VIGGLVTASFLTLLVLPVVYALLGRRGTQTRSTPDPAQSGANSPKPGD
jgi:hypothetical protein